MTEGTAQPGPDGRRRCLWALRSEDELHYHDTEWGHPVRDETGLLERICLEGFQAGLSWLVVLRKRAALRAAFHGFDPATVAAMSDPELELLLSDARLIRSRRKIEAVRTNARATLALTQAGRSLPELVWRHAPHPADDRVPVTTAEVPAHTEASARLSAELRGAGFRFVGPTTAYATMQAVGMVNDHLRDCFVRRRSMSG
ncbi:DNA-3-methyladenine glycosylase I [Lipingzhangella sp. LS1_29]|uniref:DNA-3-methyladenine glycosylase I n=1 Tax=Lipingzhangella rawalii TaxID=2055835 RepID=A0ABU2HAG5_9ACTN|nr:DNA-3-methyladenine glycosylase I [Lipingzhangella rawalii]MDS1272317.1 DNA-3-methyladenine glycosylase I [Lipingzhangella rawalii]